MYYEDQFNSNDGDDMDYYSEDDTKKSDKGYYCIQAKNNKGEHIKIEMFDSGTVSGNRIRNAITGVREEERIGSASEDLYFKVCLSGAAKRDAPVILFYETPEQYERHHNCKVSDIMREKWQEKSAIARKNKISNKKK